MARPSGSRRSSSRSGGSRSGGSRSGGSRRGASGGGSRRQGGGGRSRSGGGSRGGRGRAPRGGGSNATAIGVGVVLLIGVVAIIVIAGGKDKKKPQNYVSEELTADSVVDKGATGPTKPNRPPPPKISDEIVLHAKEIVTQAEAEEEIGNTLYEEAMTARRDGDEKTWQSKLDEARGHFINIKELWNNEIVAAIVDELDAMPSDNGYDADEVANYWIGKEAGKITKMLDKIGMITKQQRMKK